MWRSLTAGLSITVFIISLPSNLADLFKWRGWAKVMLGDYAPVGILVALSLASLWIFWDKVFSSQEKVARFPATIHIESTHQSGGQTGVFFTTNVHPGGENVAEQERLAERWRQLAPQIDHWIGAGRRIEEDMRRESDRAATLDAYVERLENNRTGWRTLAAKFLDSEFPNTGLRGLIIVKGTQRRNLRPFEWELERLSSCIGHLIELKRPAELTHWIRMSGKYR